MKKLPLSTCVLVLTFSLVLAQTSPSNSKLLSAYRGWVDPMGSINTLLEMDKQPGLSVGKD